MATWCEIRTAIFPDKLRERRELEPAEVREWYLDLKQVESFRRFWEDLKYKTDKMITAISYTLD